MEALGDSRLEYAIRLLFKHTECWEVRDRRIPLAKACEVKTFVESKGLIGDDFDG